MKASTRFFLLVLLSLAVLPFWASSPWGLAAWLVVHGWLVASWRMAVRDERGDR